ncbi:Uncharacterized protein conserved in bacteria [Metamycoplasma cloacale]|uniref:Probable cell division protein WhiA n=1 Tax=Metamycoplasma cloacale TaxID=92401 RepID=A0A2Z4LN38_9BACT|nr:DNA-binding protein WhiA [Metamycoplasma cloacale]AWX42657.1 DNA-binding protein WhiA [Metamycoplasma cloacale]VEU79541.1 Uncharacterized protein conserved in bacteria [Metamycoplasma cloacale]
MKDTFSRFIKNEIIDKKRNRTSKLELLLGVFDTGYLDNNLISIALNNIDVKNYIIQLLNDLNIKYVLGKRNNISVAYDNLTKYSCKKQTHYFSGVFLSSGTISDVESTSYHLELKLQNENKAIEIQSILNNYEFNFKILKRKNSWMLYIKRVEAICDFLKAIEAIEAYMMFEESKIERDFQNNINRLTNFDYYNQERIANANKEFLTNWDYIQKNDLYEWFSEYEIAFFKLKQENLDLTLNELSHLLSQRGINKSKSTLNNYLIKLKKIIKKIKKGK